MIPKGNKKRDQIRKFAMIFPQCVIRITMIIILENSRDIAILSTIRLNQGSSDHSIPHL